MNCLSQNCLSFTLIFSIVACSGTTEPVVDAHIVTETSTETQHPAIDSQRLSDIVKVLASDEFQGRAPGGPGEVKTVAYLVDQFQSLGLQPGGANGSWTHPVPLIHTQLSKAGKLNISAGEAAQTWQQGIDVNVSTVRAVDSIIIDDAPLVFVGFGASAPERDWDDFGDIDLAGKVAVFLVNDPDFSADAEEPVAGRFGNKRMNLLRTVGLQV
jgi:hypothetical protein